MFELSEIMASMARRRAELQGEGHDRLVGLLAESKLATALQECRDQGFRVETMYSAVTANSLLKDPDDETGPQAAATVSISKGKAELLLWLFNDTFNDRVKYAYAPLNAVESKIDAGKQWDFTEDDVLAGLAAWRELHADYFAAIDNQPPLWRRALDLVKA